MTLTIELTPEEQTAIELEASSRGLELPEFAKLRLLEKVSETVQRARAGKPKQRARIMGKYSGLLTDSETFAREKQEEIAREEARR